MKNSNKAKDEPYMREELEHAYIQLSTLEPRTNISSDDKCYNCEYFDKAIDEKTLPTMFKDDLLAFGCCTKVSCIKLENKGNNIGGVN